VENTENKKNETGRILSTLYTIIIVIAALYFVFGSFTIIRYKEQRMLMFTLELSPANVINGRFIKGWVFGNHVLETEYGEIVINHWSDIAAQQNTLFQIYYVNFQRERATHNLSINGMELPREILIRFNRFGQFGILDLNNQEIIVACTPIVVNRIHHNHIDNPNNLTFYGNIFPEDGIILTDNTEINVPFPIHWLLFFHSETETWTLRAAFGRFFLAKLPGESEFQRFTSITFGQHWGEFIEGIIFEGR